VKNYSIGSLFHRDQINQTDENVKIKDLWQSKDQEILQRGAN
jgi:hypothetical protein